MKLVRVDDEQDIVAVLVAAHISNKFGRPGSADPDSLTLSELGDALETIDWLSESAA